MAAISPEQEWKKGSAELLVLSLLEARRRHGYDISKLIGRRRAPPMLRAAALSTRSSAKRPCVGRHFSPPDRKPGERMIQGSADLRESNQLVTERRGRLPEKAGPTSGVKPDPKRVHPASIFQRDGSRQRADDGAVRLLVCARRSSKPDRIAKIEHKLDVPIGQDGRRGNFRSIADDLPVGSDDPFKTGTWKPFVIVNLHAARPGRSMLFHSRRPALSVKRITWCRCQAVESVATQLHQEPVVSAFGTERFVEAQRGSI